MFVSGDGRRGRIECDDPLCDAASPELVYHRGGRLPDGWVLSMRHQPAPGVEGHLCPEHASR
jgi:hypothetical protein